MACSVEDLINKIKRHFDTGAYKGEESVRTQICFPILRELGWDTDSPVHVRTEFPVSNLKVDIALFYPSRSPVIFIETKRPGECSPRGEEQVFQYAFRQGRVPMTILTDGDEWHFYNAYGTGDYASRKVKSIRLTKDNTQECLECFSRYLQQERVKSGDAFDDLRRDHEQTISAREAKLKIPEAWARLIAEQDLLIDLIIHEVKEISDGGYAPKKADVVTFLQELKPARQPEKQTTLETGKLSQQETRPGSEAGKVVHRYKINGEILQGRNGKDVYIKVLDYVILKYGRFQDLKSQPLNRIKSRSLGTGYHISEDRIEITKEDKHKQQLPGSKIWLNTNQSASSMSGRLIKISEFYNQLENRKVLGVWGSGAEVEFDIPTRPSAS